MRSLFFETIGSTNRYLKDHHRDLEDMTFVFADQQTAGRGRSGRKWLSEKGKNLTFSFLMKDPLILREHEKLSAVCALSVIEALESFGIKDLMIKWPNDVYASGKKICGILAEGISYEELDCIVCGIGINVNQTKFEGDYLHEPVSMKMILKEDVDVAAVRDGVCSRMIGNIDELKKGRDFFEEISARDYLKGTKVFALIGNERRQVEVLGMTRDLRLQVKDGEEILDLDSGEITFHL